MHRALGIVYLAVGLLVAGASLGALIMGRYVLPRTATGVSAVLIYAFGTVGLAFSFPIMRRGLRALQLSAEQVLARDRRPPVLYLRSFLDDSAPLSLPELGLVIPNTLVPAPVHRAEDSLAPLLNCIGPFIAIGKPGESLPETGAARLYVTDSQWKERVAGLISRCRLTIILAGETTGGVHWEIRQAVASLRPEQLVFFFPRPG